MSNNSKKELLEWLALKPRTQGWGAVVAYDRNKCNNLLLQDYINKFTLDSYLPPINKSVPTGSANWEHLHDWVTDVPRLSFEDSSTTAGGTVNLRMAVIGGTQVRIDNATGVKRAIAIHSIDALEHPELIADQVKLSKISGAVGKDAGEVVLDLGDVDTAKGNWELTFANTQFERDLGGLFFKKYYKEADKEKRLYHLGKISYTEQQLLKPASFTLRTITANGAHSKTANNFGDGAVELFVCMEGDQEGAMPPDDDWIGLVPDDATEEYDSTILLSNDLLMRRVVVDGLSDSFVPAPSFEQAYDDKGFFKSIIAKSGPAALYSPKFFGKAGGYDIEVNEIMYLAWAHRESLRVSLQDDRSIKLDWMDASQIRKMSCVIRKDGQDRYLAFDSYLGVEANIVFEIDSNTGSILASPKNFKFLLRMIMVQDVAAEVKHFLTSDQGEYANFVRRFLQDTPGLLFGNSVEINAFVLNSILFTGYGSVRPKSVDLPGDLVIFSRFSVFTITTPEHLMGHGATHTFRVSPDYKGKVQWSVAAIPGNVGAIGTITENGVYTSPSITDIPGTFTRVRVTAKDLQSQYSSSALVTVVARDITVNPVVQICNASNGSTLETRTLSANTLGEGRLEWKVKAGSGTIPSTANSEGKNTYTAGQRDNSAGALRVDEIEVRNLATQKTQSSYVVVTHDSSELLTVTMVMEESSFPAGKVKLVVLRREEEVPVDWEVVVGNGEIDDSGMYTGRDGQHRFALIVATQKNDEYRKGWIILPWPLFELPDKPPDDFLE
jgi:hypothetical protein